MGLGQAAHIIERLIENGAPATRPAAAVARGTHDAQRVVTATLGTLLSACTAAELDSPALLVVGDVVALQPQLAWFNVATHDDLSRTA
jgi:uroporphyrin-III C-methyltransferase/precorrin-2 dehydrogenase/sirohydrochlorin ferrochelatase